jgi:predicted GIY-YIG superfamily endonuclease
MHYVYFSKSLTSDFRFVGYKSNLALRLIEHYHGLNKFTKPYKPLNLMLILP